MNKKGTALIIVTISLSIMLLFVATVWRTTVFVYEIGLVRQNYEQRYWSSFAFMMWSVAVCKENFDQFLNYTQAQQHKIVVNNWPPRGVAQVSPVSRGTIIIAKQGAQLEIQAYLENNPSLNFACRLQRTRQEDDSIAFCIENWNIT